MASNRLDTAATGFGARELAAFFAIYVVWGSTYLAIRVAVETIPPLMTAGVRHLLAGLVLYLWARGWKTRVGAAGWGASLILGVLFFLIGHGTLHWAEQTVPSGIAALLVATEPLWIAVLMPPAHGRRFTMRIVLGLSTGLLGVGLLIPPAELTSDSTHLAGFVAILIGAMSWAFGIRYSATAPLPRDPFVRSATALLCGSALLLTASLATGEMARVDIGAISGRSLLGLAYLIIGGSVVAFSAYTWLLERCSATLVATHTYVNPVVAVLLGWLLAGEPLTLRILWATGLILVAVVLLRSETSSRRIPRANPARARSARAAPNARLETLPRSTGAASRRG
jgi:drug/metabolite transporter (DMT)-like permease